MRPMDWGRQNNQKIWRKKEKTITAGTSKLSFVSILKWKTDELFLALISCGITRSNSMLNTIQRNHSGDDAKNDFFQFCKNFNSSDSSLHFFLQSGLPAEQRRMSLLNSFQNLSYRMWDFHADSGPENDGDNFVAKVQRRDIVMLGNFVCRLFHGG